MYPRSVLPLLAAFGCICGYAMAKPAPTEETLRFVAACVREYVSADFFKPERVREMRKYADIQERRRFFSALAQVHASQAYLRSLSARAFGRRLADALYLSTPRSRERCAVAYVAALRGIDVIENSRRMNDAVTGIRPPHKPQEWETRLLETVFNSKDASIAYMTVLTVPSRLIEVYRKHPEDRVLGIVYDYPAGDDGEGAMQMDAALSTALGINPEAMLRAAAGNDQRIRRLVRCLAGYNHNLTPAEKSVVQRAFRRIERSKSPLAAAARKCLQGIAEDDAYQAQRVRRERAKRTAPAKKANR